MIRYIPSLPRCTAAMLAGRPRDDSPIDVLPLSTIWLTHRARTAVRRAAELAGLSGGGQVLAPSYHRGSELDSLLSAGAEVQLYRIDEAAQLDLIDLAARITPDTKAIYLTHMFGFPPPVDAVRQLCRRHHLVLIQDRALASFHDAAAGAPHETGDLLVFSFTKALPVPDGGALVVRGAGETGLSWPRHPSPRRTRMRRTVNLVKQSGLNRARRMLHRPVKARYSASGLGRMPDAYHFQSDMADAAISPLSIHMIRRLSASAIAARRRENFLALAARLRSQVPNPWRLTDLAAGISPLLYPVLVDNRADVLARLHHRGVGAIPFWSGYHPAFPLHEFPDTRRLKDHLVGLPVHQDLTVEDMNYVAGELLAAMRL